MGLSWSIHLKYKATSPVNLNPSDSIPVTTPAQVLELGGDNDDDTSTSVPLPPAPLALPEHPPLDPIIELPLTPIPAPAVAPPPDHVNKSITSDHTSQIQ